MGDFHPHAYSMAAVTLGITPLFQAATMRYRKGQTVCQLSLFFFFSLSLFLEKLVASLKTSPKKILIISY